jgi:hypothetical protein
MDQDIPAKLNWRPLGLSIPQLLFLGLSVTLCTIIVLTAVTSTAGFNPYNPNWDGTQEFRDLADSTGELTIITSTNQYQTGDPNATTAFVIAPEKRYSDSERERIGQFVQNGGLLVVADESSSSGNSLLTSIGASARFDGRILRDEQNNFESSFLPVIPDSSNHTLVSAVDSLTLNYGTAVRPGTATPIINSSEVSYLVRNRNETLEPQTELRSYPVVTIESVGEGTVVVVGDPSIFISSMLEKSDNEAFVSTLLDQRPEILFDQSHNQSLPLLVSVMLALRSSPPAAGVVLSIIVGLLVGGNSRYNLTRRLLWRQRLDSMIPAGLSELTGQFQSPPEYENQTLISDRESLKKELQERHPEWDEEQIDRVIAGVLSDTPNTIDNE